MNTITGHRSRDLILFFGVLLLLLVSVPRLIVYDKGTPSEVTVVAVGGDGVRVPIETPEPFQGIQPGIFSTERLIRAFAETAAAKELSPSNGYLEWSVHYSLRWQQEKLSRILITNSSDKDE